MAKLVYAADLKSVARMGFPVQVRVGPPHGFQSFKSGPVPLDGSINGFKGVAGAGAAVGAQYRIDLSGC